MFDFDEEPLNNAVFYPASHDQPIRVVTDALSSAHNLYSVNSMWAETQFIDTRVWSTTKKYIQVSLIMKSYLRSKFREMAEQYMKSKGIGLLW